MRGVGDAASYRANDNDARVSALDYAAYEPPWKIRVESDVPVGPWTWTDQVSTGRTSTTRSTTTSRLLFLLGGWMESCMGWESMKIHGANHRSPNYPDRAWEDANDLVLLPVELGDRFGL